MVEMKCHGGSLGHTRPRKAYAVISTESHAYTKHIITFIKLGMSSARHTNGRGQDAKSADALDHC